MSIGTHAAKYEGPSNGSFVLKGRWNSHERQNLGNLAREAQKNFDEYTSTATE